MNIIFGLRKMIKWNKYFDHIFCITYINNGRYEGLSKELDRVGILKSGIFEFIYDCDFKYKKEMYNNFYTPWVCSFYLKPCTIQHVKIWNIIECLGYERVLILEDDIGFLKDLNEIEKILDNAEFKDITLLHYSCCGENIYYSAACYTVNKHGAEVLLDNFDYNKFTVVDQLFMGGNYGDVTHIRDDVMNGVKLKSYHKIINSRVHNYELSSIYPMICQQHFQSAVRINTTDTLKDFDKYNFWMEKNDKLE